MEENLKRGDIVRIILGGELTRTRYVVVSDRCRNGLRAGYWVRSRNAPNSDVGSFAREEILKAVERHESQDSDDALA